MDSEKESSNLQFICSLVGVAIVLIAIVMLYFLFKSSPFSAKGGRKFGGMKGGCGCLPPPN